MMTLSLRRLLPRLLLMGVLWVVLAGFDTRAWALAAVIVLIAALTSLRMVPPGTFQLSARGLLRFIPFFLLYSIRGGVDVALRAVRRSPDLHPATIEVSTHLPAGPSRYFYAAVIGLLPGTLTARMEGARLEVHVLDRRRNIEAQLRSLETRVAELFGADR